MNTFDKMILPYLAMAVLLAVTVYAASASFRQKPDDSRLNWLFPDGTSRSFRISVGILTAALTVGLVGWFSVSARKSTRLSSRFLIPEGYIGRVRIEFEVSAAPALPVEVGQYVLKIPSNGVLKTSSPEQYGWANDSYYYYSAAGAHQLSDSDPHRLVWGKINGEATGSSGKTKYEEFFVGTKSQFMDQSGAGGKATP